MSRKNNSVVLFLLLCAVVTTITTIACAAPQITAATASASPQDITTLLQPLNTEGMDDVLTSLNDAYVKSVRGQMNHLKKGLSAMENKEPLKRFLAGSKKKSERFQQWKRTASDRTSDVEQALTANSRFFESVIRHVNQRPNDVVDAVPTMMKNTGDEANDEEESNNNNKMKASSDPFALLDANPRRGFPVCPDLDQQGGSNAQSTYGTLDNVFAHLVRDWAVGTSATSAAVSEHYYRRIAKALLKHSPLSFASSSSSSSSNDDEERQCDEDGQTQQQQKEEEFHRVIVPGVGLGGLLSVLKKEIIHAQISDSSTITECASQKKKKKKKNLHVELLGTECSLPFIATLPYVFDGSNAVMTDACLEEARTKKKEQQEREAAASRKETRDREKAKACTFGCSGGGQDHDERTKLIAPWLSSFVNLEHGDERDQLATHRLCLPSQDKSTSAQQQGLLPRVDTRIVASDIFAPSAGIVSSTPKQNDKKETEEQKKNQHVLFESASAVVTCFAFDAVDGDITQLMHKIDAMLTPAASGNDGNGDGDGGVWINLGPLHYHSQNIGPLLSYGEVISYFVQVLGYELVERSSSFSASSSEEEAAAAATAPKSLLPYAKEWTESLFADAHRTVFFVLRKKKKTTV